MAERLDKSGLTRLWRAIQLKITNSVKSYSMSKSGDSIVLYDGETSQTVNLDTPPTLSWYGTCSTGSSNPNKVATVSESGFTLVKGCNVSIKFTDGHSMPTTSITLNVNSTGAKSINVNGLSPSSTNLVTWSPGTVVKFVYDGTNWVYLSQSNLGYLFSNPGPIDLDSFWIISGDASPGVYCFTDSDIEDTTSLPADIGGFSYFKLELYEIYSDGSRLDVQELTGVYTVSESNSISTGCQKWMRTMNHLGNLSDWVYIPDATGVLF